MNLWDALSKSAIIALFGLVVAFGAPSAYGEEAPAEEKPAEAAPAEEAPAPPPIALEGNEERRKVLDPMQGQAAPAFQLENWINSDALTVESLKDKVVLLDFWGVWCGPCRAAVPHLKDLHAKYADKGLVIVGVHTSSGAENAPEYVKSEEIPYPIGFDTENKVVAAYNVDSFPDLYLIDHTGVLRYADIANSDFANIENAVAQAIEERTKALAPAEKPEAPAEGEAPAEEAPAEPAPEAAPAEKAAEAPAEEGEKS